MHRHAASERNTHPGKTRGFLASMRLPTWCTSLLLLIITVGMHVCSFTSMVAAPDTCALPRTVATPETCSFLLSFRNSFRVRESSFPPTFPWFGPMNAFFSSANSASATWSCASIPQESLFCWACTAHTKHETRSHKPHTSQDPLP